MGPRNDLSFCTYITAWLAPELLVSMGSSPHLWFCAFKRTTLGPKLHVSMGPRPHLRFSACKTACLASELLVSTGSSHHLWFLHAKQRLLVPNNKSWWVPDITCRFVRVIQRDSTWITCLYGSQPLSVVFACKTVPFGAELQVCMGPWPHLSFCACTTAWLASELLASMDPSPHLWFLDAKQWLLDLNNKSLWVAYITCRFVHAKQRD